VDKLCPQLPRSDGESVIARAHEIASFDRYFKPTDNHAL